MRDKHISFTFQSKSNKKIKKKIMINMQIQRSFLLYLRTPCKKYTVFFHVHAKTNFNQILMNT